MRKTPFRLAFPILSAVVIFQAGVVGSSQAQTLDEALRAAYTNNPELTSERAAVRATDEGVPQAVSDFRPSVDVVGTAGRSVVRSNTATGTARSQSRNPRSVGVTVTQPIYSGGQTMAAVSEAENNVKSARSNLVSVEQNVLFDAVTAFMNVYRDAEVVKLNIANEQVLRRNLTATQDRYDAGGITITNVHQSEARLSGATADRVTAEANLEQSRAAYQNVIGKLPSDLTKPDAPDDLPDTKAEAVADALENNPDIVSAKFDEKASLANVKEIRGQLLPSLNLTGSAARNFDSSSEDSRVDTYTALLTLTVPIYGAGLEYSQLREARQQVIEQRELIRRAERTVAQSASQAWDSLQSARSQIVSFKAQIASARTALNGVRDEANFGTRTILDVLDQEQELLDAQTSLVRAERDEIVAIFQLKQAMGQLTVVQLGIDVDEAYDPVKHYKNVRNRWFGGESPAGMKADDPRRDDHIMRSNRAQRSAARQPSTEVAAQKPEVKDLAPDAQQDGANVARSPDFVAPSQGLPKVPVELTETTPQQTPPEPAASVAAPKPGGVLTVETVTKDLETRANAKLAAAAAPGQAETPATPKANPVTLSLGPAAMSTQLPPAAAPIQDKLAAILPQAGTPKVPTSPAPLVAGIGRTTLSSPAQSGNSATGPKFGVQLGAFLSPDRAKAAWRSFAQSAPSLLSTVPPQFQTAKLSAQVDVTKVIAGAYKTKAQALDLCTKLKSNNLECFTVQY